MRRRINKKGKRRSREEGCNRARYIESSGVPHVSFLDVSLSIVTPFLYFFSLSFFLSFSVLLRFVFRGTPCTPRTMHSNAVVYTAVHKGREEDSERDANSGGWVEQVEVRSRWKLRNSISILEQTRSLSSSAFLHSCRGPARKRIFSRPCTRFLICTHVESAVSHNWIVQRVNFIS